MSDYYDYHATVQLVRPTVLIGLPGVDYRQVGRDTSSLTGLPFVDVDRWVEHEAGQSLYALLSDRGAEVLEQAESRMTEKALGSPPPGIIVLGDAALAQPTNLERALTRGFVVYFKQSLSNVYWELRRQAQVRGGLNLPHLPQPLETVDQLRPLFELRKAAYQRAHHTIDMAETGVEGAVRQLMKALPTVPVDPDDRSLRVMK